MREKPIFSVLSIQCILSIIALLVTVSPLSYSQDDTQVIQANLKITEVMYNPAGGTDYEFIELYNAHTSQTLVLDGLTFSGGLDYTFPKGTTITPQSYLVLTRNSNDALTKAFRDYYQLKSSVFLLGPYIGKLSNSGDKINLKASANGKTVIEFEFKDSRGWPLSADGGGHSLVPINSAIATEHDGSLYYGGNWRASAFIGGSPGAADPDPVANIVINEVLANPSSNNAGDWIELYNTSSTLVQLDNWYLSDDISDLRKHSLKGIPVPAHQFALIENFTEFGLGKDGDDVFLAYLPNVAGADRIVDFIRFKGQSKDKSIGRFEDGAAYWCEMERTPEQANLAGNAHVVIDEIMYHPTGSPDDTDDFEMGEYIELYNPQAKTVNCFNDLGTWHIAGGLDFVFPANMTMPSGSRLLIVNFDPKDKTKLTEFMTKYGLSAIDSPVIGPYTGKLSNKTDHIELEKPFEVDATDGTMNWELTDEIMYFQQAPWTPDSDGTGKSLQRVSVSDSGNDPNNWKAAKPSPGVKGNIETAVHEWMMF